MHRIIWRTGLLALLSAACSDDVAGPVPATFEPRCGVDGPVQILPFEEAEEQRYGIWLAQPQQ